MFGLCSSGGYRMHDLDLKLHLTCTFDSPCLFTHGVHNILQQLSLFVIRYTKTHMYIYIYKGLNRYSVVSIHTYIFTLIYIYIYMFTYIYIRKIICLLGFRYMCLICSYFTYTSTYMCI